MIENKLVRWSVAKYHPNERCISSNHNGQCPYIKQNETEYCVRHGANKGKEGRAAEVQRNYRLKRWKDRVGEFADNDGIKSLREEVGILRLILEEMMNACETSMDLLLYSNKMSDLVTKIEKLVTSCDKLENRMGILLSKDSVLHLASIYVQIINNHVSDPDIIEQISMEMATATEEVSNPIIES